MKNVIKIIIGVMIASLCIFGYSRDRLFELTFISNTFCGLIYTADGILSLARRGRGLPAFIWHITLSLHLPVFICVFLGFPIGGAFFFLHFLNPIILFWIYMLAGKPDISRKGTRLLCIFLSPLSFLSYALFDLIRFYITGELVYGIVKPESINSLTVILIALWLYWGIVAMNAVLIGIRRAVIKHRENSKQKQNELPV